MAKIPGLTLTTFLPDRPGRTFHLEAGRRHIIGRAPDADIRLDDASVSRHHLVVFDSGASWWIEDRLSKNGTRLDGRPIDRAALGSECWIEAGGVPIRVHSRPPAHDAEADQQEDASEAAAPEDAGLVQMLERVCSIAGCERASIWEPCDGQQFEPIARIGSLEPPASMASIQAAASHDAEVFCSDTRGAQARVQSRSVAEGGIRALFAVAVHRHGPTPAILYADSRTTGKLFTEHDAELLRTAAGQIALLLDSLGTRQRIEHLQDEIG